MSASLNGVQPTLSALLIDISGTLLIGSAPTPGAARALARLRAARVPFRFCSNTSKESTQEICRRLAELSMHVLPGEVWTSIGALKGVLRDTGVRRPAYLPYTLLSQSARAECLGIDSGMTNHHSQDDTIEPYDAVVVGLAPSVFDYEHLNTAFRILVREHQNDKQLLEASLSSPTSKPPLIALHKARYIQAFDRALSLGPGPFVAALEEASGTRALVVGKPTKLFFETVIKSFQGGNIGDGGGGRIAVIGDDVSADLGEGAIELGLWRVLVKTGKYRAGDESREGAYPPDEVCESFADFVDRFLDQDRFLQSTFFNCSRDETEVGAVGRGSPLE
ncbi:HAD-like domain-containing protein [Pisolithus orientalis]|uniref:HAD-like domain-containing protein n=1 Tax=Pisolithus orientalis TaxID=936130 RepID=UPI0022244862|nr:HAD-like domain-containing protein [Pisolithus orientalis]KAI5996583.1 HAD-like domain-containing protein [Pisolithus orientalis]